MNYSQILSEIQNSNLSMDELRNLNSVIVAMSKNKRRVDNQVKKFSLSVGQTVLVDHKDCIGQTYTVHKINRTKSVLRDSKGRLLNVPISMITVG